MTVNEVSRCIEPIKSDSEIRKLIDDDSRKWDTKCFATITSFQN